MPAVHLPRHRAVDMAAVVVGLGAGISIALGIIAEPQSVRALPGGYLTAGGRLTGLLGTYLLLIMVVLVARVGIIERTIGQDRLVTWHRRLGPWPLLLLGTHVVMITLGYARSATTGFFHEAWVIFSTYSGMMIATVALLLLIMAGVTSVRLARSKMSHETWWAVHLYTYLALALSIPHQLATGASFVGHPLAQAWWIALWCATAGLVIVYRIGIPVWRSAYHKLQVVSVQEEAPGVVSIHCKGNHLEQLSLAGGQFFQWRFLRRGLWWQAHPYSLSALIQAPYMRVTIKDLGDHSQSAATLLPGTHIAIEGPYGAFTKHAAKGEKIALIGAGVGITPLRALLEDLDVPTDIRMLIRAQDPAAIVHREESEAILAAHGQRMLVQSGSRKQSPMNEHTLRALIPDIIERDVYVCGPDSFADDVIAAARFLGVPARHIHHERFVF